MLEAGIITKSDHKISMPPADVSNERHITRGLAVTDFNIAEASLSTTISFSYFENTLDIIPKELTVYLAEFRKVVITPKLCKEKDSAPLLSPAIYKPKDQRIENVHRNGNPTGIKGRQNANVQSWGLLPLDYDHQNEHPREFLQPLIDAGLMFDAVPTASNRRICTKNPDGAEYFYRVFLYSNKAIPANKQPTVWSAIRALTGNRIDKQAKALEQMFYIPFITDAEEKLEIYTNEGGLLDWESLKLEQQEESLNNLNGFDHSVFERSSNQFDIREYIPHLTPNGKVSDGWHHFDCPNCKGKGKLYINIDTGAYNCFHSNNNTCSIEGIRFSLGAPKQTKLSSNFEFSSIELSKDARTGTVEEVFSTILSHLPTRVDFKAAANMKEDERLHMKEHVVVCADLLVKTAKALGFDFTIKGNLHVYNTQYWLETDINTAKKDGLIYFLSSAMEKLGIWNVRNQFHTSIDHLCSQFLTRVLFDQYIPKRTDKILINLKNGTYDFKERKLRDFDKDDFLTYRLSFPYDPNAIAPKWEKFLNQVLPIDDNDPDGSRQKVLAEYVGSCFTNLKTEKMLFNYGSGGNGKTVVMDVISALVGQENVSNSSLKNICTQGSFLAQLNNKLINLSSEASDYVDSQLIKDLASKEVITVCRKYELPFEMINYARVICNANELPQKGKEFLDGFKRRFLIIPFNYKVTDEEKQLGFASTIIKDELPGILNWVLRGLDRLITQDGFTPCRLSDDEVNKYMTDGDTVAMWLEDNCWMEDKDLKPKDCVQLKGLFADYMQWGWEQKQKHLLGRDKFKKRLSEMHGYSSFKYQHRDFYRLKKQMIVIDESENIKELFGCV
jgi:putative DNA primase/helicase